MTLVANFENFQYCPNSTFNIGKITKIVVEKFSISEVISQKTSQRGGEGGRVGL